MISKSYGNNEMSSFQISQVIKKGLIIKWNWLVASLQQSRQL